MTGIILGLIEIFSSNHCASYLDSLLGLCSHGVLVSNCILNYTLLLQLYFANPNHFSHHCVYKANVFFPNLDYLWMFDLHKIGDVSSCLFTRSVAAVSLSNNLFSLYHIGSKT